ncbi:MAG: adenylate kinase [Dehalococcoidia bacterium]|nr:adenylate kinase [Dehalococcoidia bacterium]
MYLVLLGAPGAGKGTQASAIASKFGWAHIASGDLLRAEVARNTDLGKTARQYMEKGALVPDETVIQMIIKRLNAPDTAGGVILDGFPRTTKQAEALDRELEKLNKKIDYALYINVPAEELIKRISGRWVCKQCQTPYHLVNSPPKIAGKCDKCGGELYQRPDDTEATVRERIKVYLAQTTPVLDYYRQRSKLIEINGNADIETVTASVISALSQLGSKGNDHRKIS